ncbi:MAG TPA: VTT domain-containing protein [Aquihabitans sp.]|nr:VTT domain-containing protein [Aquihabitans sp.]
MRSLLLATGPWKPEFWLEKAGAAAAWVIVAIIFAESGLFFGFFLPGDSLLFMAGFLTSQGAADFVAPGATGEALAPVVDGMPHILVLLPLLFVAAFLGDQVGYAFGKWVGPAIFTREDSRFFKQSHVTKAHDFLERYGPKTVFLARFVPIVRTFAPIVAGVGQMRYRTFLTFNLLGAFVWAVGITTLGHFLGNVEFIRDNIEYTIIVIVLLSLTPVFVELVQARRHRHATAEPDAA